MVAIKASGETGDLKEVERLRDVAHYLGMHAMCKAKVRSHTLTLRKAQTLHPAWSFSAETAFLKFELHTSARAAIVRN